MKPEMQLDEQNQQGCIAEVQTYGATRCRESWDGRITPPDAARFLGITERTLRCWRDERRGPPAVYRPLWGFSWSYETLELYKFKLFSAIG
jgi:hypothetical protein